MTDDRGISLAPAGRTLEWGKTGWIAFGDGGASDETITVLVGHMEPDRRWGIEDERGRYVATCGIFGTDLTVPGDRTVPCAAVAIVAVVPTHRRRGLAAQLVAHHLRDSRERGEILSILEASEGAIYGRWGYGAAAWRLTGTISRAGSAFRSPVDVGHVEIVEGDEALATLPPLYERLRRERPGEIARPAPLWTSILADPEEERDGESPRIDVVHRDATGDADGFVSYRVASKWEDAMPQSTATVLELHAASPEVYASLWRFALDLDLMVTTRSHNIVVEEPLRWLLEDPRQLRCSNYADGQWVRILDLGGALTGRGYLVDGDLTLEIHDPVFDDLTGTWRVHVTDGEATVERTDGPADLRLGIGEVGALYLGGVSARALTTGGRIEELTPGAAAAADRLFASTVPPLNSTYY